MKAIAQRILALGVLLLTSSFWLSPLLNWIADERWKGAVLANHRHNYEYSLLPFRTLQILYAAGFIVTLVAGSLLAFHQWKRNPKDFVSPDYRNLWTPKFISRRVLTVGVLFLLAPAWCFPFVNDLAVSMVNAKYANTPVSFTGFDIDCVMLEFGTTRMLYNIGLGVTFLAGLILMFESMKHVKDQGQELRSSGA